MLANKLQPVRRVVTGHDKHCKAIVDSDQAFTPQTISSGDAAFTLLWTTANVPADNNDGVDGRERNAGLTIEQGSVLRVVDMLPNCESPMHRTNSIDYGIVLWGTVELELDDNKIVQLGPGDICVQRGTIHRWRSVGDQPCRIVFVLTQASAYLHNGQGLAEMGV